MACTARSWTAAPSKPLTVGDRCPARPDLPPPHSRRTCRGVLSSRSPRHAGWRSRPSPVHAANTTSYTSSGRTQCTPCASPRGTPPAGGSGSSSGASSPARSGNFRCSPLITAMALTGGTSASSPRLKGLHPKVGTFSNVTDTNAVGSEGPPRGGRGNRRGEPSPRRQGPRAVGSRHGGTPALVVAPGDDGAVGLQRQSMSRTGGKALTPVSPSGTSMISCCEPALLQPTSASPSTACRSSSALSDPGFSTATLPARSTGPRATPPHPISLPASIQLQKVRFDSGVSTLRYPYGARSAPVTLARGGRTAPARPPLTRARGRPLTPSDSDSLVRSSRVRQSPGTFQSSQPRRRRNRARRPGQFEVWGVTWVCWLGCGEASRAGLIPRPATGVVRLGRCGRGCWPPTVRAVRSGRGRCAGTVSVRRLL